jgi:hypothetical protein
MLALELRKLTDNAKNGKGETRAKKLAEHMKNLARATAPEGGAYVNYKVMASYWTQVDVELATRLLLNEGFTVTFEKPQITLQKPEWDVVGNFRIEW